MSALTRNTFLQRYIRSGTMLALVGAFMVAQQTALADDHCPAPALSVKESPITSVDEQNYSLAESQVIFADYVRKIAAATCGGGVGQLMHLRNTPDPTDRIFTKIGPKKRPLPETHSVHFRRLRGTAFDTKPCKNIK